MRKVRLAILGSSPCRQCTANCCRQNGHAFAVLLRGDERRRFAPWSQDVLIERDGAARWERVLTYRDGRCPFLGDDLLCTIYEDRPQSCRDFECISGYDETGPAGHSRFLQLNPDVLQLLRDL